MNNKILKKQLEEFLQTYYDGSFSRMACDYTHVTGMTPQEVVTLLEAMRQEMIKNK